jgi:hypothetical protein
VNYHTSLQSANKQQPAVKQGGMKNKGHSTASYYTIENEKTYPLLLTLPFNAIKGFLYTQERARDPS